MTQVIYSLHNDNTLKSWWLNREAPVTLLMLLFDLYSSIYCLLAFHKPACVTLLLNEIYTMAYSIIPFAPIVLLMSPPELAPKCGHRFIISIIVHIIFT